MKKRILSLCALMLANVIFVLNASAVEVPWREPWAKTVSVKRTGVNSKQLKVEFGITKKEYLSETFKEYNANISIMTGKPNAFITPEFMNYYMVYEAIANTLYSKDQNNFEMDADLEATLAKSKAGTLQKKDLKNRRWIHMINAIDKEEKNCLAMNVINGVVGGCGDIWQDGITDEEVVCHNGYNYLKCHVGCMNKIYNRQADVTPGFCPEEK